MQEIKFEALEPYVGTFYNEGPDMSDEEIIKMLEQAHPELIDFEIVSIDG